MQIQFKFIKYFWRKLKERGKKRGGWEDEEMEGVRGERFLEDY